MSGTISTAITRSVTLTTSPTTVTAAGSVVTTSGDAIIGPAGTVPVSGWSIVNAGTITASGPGANGIDLAAAGSIANSGVIAGYNNGITVTGGKASVTNSGTIDSSPTKIVPGSPNNLYDGIYFGAGGSVTNLNAGTIYGGIGGIDIAGGLGTVNNSGLIETTTLQGNGVALESGGTVINTGTTGIYGDFSGVSVYGAAGIVTNSAVIDALGLNGYGIYLAAGGTVTNTASGSVIGSYDGIVAAGATATVSNAGYVYGSDVGVYLLAGGRITNLSGAAIVSTELGVMVNGGGTVINAGTIDAGAAGTAVSFADGRANNLTVQSGGVFIGDVIGGGGGSVLELGAEASGTTGTLSGIGGQITAFGTIAFDAGDAWQLAGSFAGFGGETITGFAAADSILLSGVTGVTASVSGSNLTLTSGGVSEVLTFTAHGAGTLHVQTVGANTTVTLLPCFVAGTGIATPYGEVAVEALRVGDAVLTVSGEVLPVTWTGAALVDCDRHGNPAAVLPVRIDAHAFGPGMPDKDLFLSPDHAVLAEGVLIPIKYLLNGLTVTQPGRAEVRYHHIELAHHDVVLAHGLPAETYLDIGDRAALGLGRTEWSDVDAVPRDVQFLRDALAFAPIRVTGTKVDRVRGILTDRARAQQLTRAA
ncbi:Hint domain-containing protein [Acidisoma cellulosilytica]|uniref:Hint domain-containing protein n=1 Tax=Acidisoma cellulosilyticum TaxID=2802395 RepID=A0A964E3Y6_9PROT|nr:Hint domain-containing protein [Acidisoma cellulosilyticum]MCB8880891.1 Hint domain-containing protein [Acidisoma cellulosilyticum]